MTKVRFTVAYDGSEYCGWQRQNHYSKLSVQQVLEEALEKLFEEKIGLSASGRTDSGVHALNQVCHFSTERSPEKLMKWDFCWGMARHLPPTIVVKKAWIAPEDFHATLSATHKTYRYWVYNQHRASPFLMRYADWVRHPMNIEVLQACCDFIKGNQDFASFRSIGSDVQHTVREIFDAKWSWRKPNLLQFEVTGSGFLKQMVRNLVGTMMLIEKDGLPPEKMKEILLLKDRKFAGPPAPACGLHMYRVYYPQDLDNRCIALLKP
ncbi:MAG: tRNA pseudouridine(38-40) synthase TruA [Pseudobdellovibrionaceae bacterium]